MKQVVAAIIVAIYLLAGQCQAATPGEVAEKAMEGYRLFTRDSLPTDRADGYAMMLDAAWEGDAKAANNIGWLMEHGIYVEKDLRGALRWYERASDQYLPAASLNYVEIIFNNPESLEGKPADRQRVADASYRAGIALTMGRGLPYDYKRGEALLIRAGLLGNTDAALTLAQQLEMYPDSFSYLPLEKILEECRGMMACEEKNLPHSKKITTEDLLDPNFWYSMTPSLEK